MGYVLADQQGWLNTSEPFQVVPLNTFAKLREAVNDGTADFFMWEHFTSKKYFGAELKRLGEIYTPWSSWKIVARDPSDHRIEAMMQTLNQGVEYFNRHKDEAVQYISTELDYSAADAEAWLKTVHFADDVTGVDPAVIERTISTLEKAGVLDSADGREMIAIERKS